MATRASLDRLTRNEFAHLGAGKVGYIRKMRSEDVSRVFPEAPDLNPGLDLWALFGADGTLRAPEVPEAAAVTLLDGLSWWASALAAARGVSASA